MADPVNYTNIKLNDDLRALLEDTRRDVFLSLKCHDIGQVQEVNYANQTCKVKIMYKKTNLVPNKTKNSPAGVERPEYIPQVQEYPLLIDVPFVVLHGGQGGLKMPVAQGDFCLLLYNDRALDDWFIASQETVLSSNRLHSISDAVALVGLRSSKTSYSEYDGQHVELFFGETKIALGTKVKIENNTQNLNDLLQQLVTAVKDLVTATAAITVTGVTSGGGTSGIPANAATINAIGTQLTTIASDIGGLLE